MDACSEEVVEAGGMGLEKLKSGVVTNWVVAGDEKEDGVEACSVANRPGVGVEAELKKLHPRMKISVMIVHSSLALFMIQLD